MSEHAGQEEELSREAFLAGFRTEERCILEEADAVGAATAEGGGQVHESLDALLARARALEAAFTRAAQLLPAYDVQRCSAALEALTQSLGRRREELAPRGRFAFRRRAPARAAAPGAAEPAAAAAVPAPAPPQAPAPPAGAGGGTAERLEGQRGALLARGAAELGGRDVVLSGLEGCRVLLLGVVGALRCQDLRGCEVVVAAVASSALLHGCRGCVVTLAAKQLRLHDSEDVLLHLRTLSRPALERSRRISVAPFDLACPGLEAHLAEASLGGGPGDAWAEVQDFDWHRRQASPHWRVVPPELRRARTELPPDAGAEARPSGPAEAAVPDLSALERCRAWWAEAADDKQDAARSAEEREPSAKLGDGLGTEPSGAEPAEGTSSLPSRTCGVESLGSDDEF